MSESAKTFSLIGVAVVLALVATFSRARLSSDVSEGNVGQALFPEWTDAAAAKSLQITNVDETTNELNRFKVADVDGRWVVPSHDNYPANAEDHVFKAATSIIGLKVLAVESDSPGDQEEYGVVEPSEKTLTSSNFAGFGRLVVVKDATGKDLAQLIVGHESKSQGDSGANNLRFVRRAGQDRIYLVSLDTDVLTTKFQDWVDTDILALKQHWDINSLQLRDYAFDNNAIARKDDIDLAFDDKANWSVKKLTEFKGNKPEVTKLPADEELDSTKINDLKTSLSGLKLDDVRRKPAGFIEKLKAGKDYRSDPEAQQSLAKMGFYCDPEDKPTDIFSSGGDMTVGMKDGVEYTVRFGGSGLSIKHDSGDKKDASAKDAKHMNVERVVFVTAHFNPDLIPKPVIKPMPEAKKPEAKKTDTTKPDATKPEDKKPETKKPEEKAPEVKTSTEKAPDAKAPDAKAPETKAPDAKAPEKKPDAKATDKPADATKSSRANSRLSGELLALADTTDDVKKPDDAKKPDAPKASDDKAPATADKAPADVKQPEKKSPDAKTDDNKKPAETTPADKKPVETAPTDKKPVDKTPDAVNPAAGKPTVEPPKSDTQLADEEAARDAERKQIETDNRRAQDQYDETVKKGKAHAKELNNRFADWYYLISDDDYKKVHVGLSDIVKKKPETESSGLGPVPKDPFDKGGFHLPHP